MFQSAARDDVSHDEPARPPVSGIRLALELVPVFVGDRHPITLSALREALRQHPRLAFAAGTGDPSELVRLVGTVKDPVCLINPNIIAPFPGLYRQLVGAGTSVVLWADGDSGRMPHWDPTLQAIVLSKRSECAVVLETLVHSRSLSAGRRERSGGITLPALTRRESEIVGAVRAGLQNKEIASRLGISPGTVKVHLHSIYRKLGLERRSQLIQLAEHDPIATRLAMLE